MTLMEVLSAITVGFVVLAATFGLLESTLRLNTGVMSKTDAMQRGRLAMDVVTQQLRSQVCLDLDNPAVVEGDANSVTFYTDFSEGDGSVPPAKRRLEFDPATGDIRWLEYRALASASPVTPDSFPTSPTGSNLVLENAALQEVGGAPVPFLRYFAYHAVGNPPVPEISEELVPPLDAAEAARVAKVEIAFFARPTGARDNSKGVNLSDQILARHADPNLAVPDPACV